MRCCLQWIFGILDYELAVFRYEDIRAAIRNRFCIGIFACKSSIVFPHSCYKEAVCKKSMEKMLDTEWLRFLFFPVFTISAIAVMLSVFESVQTVEQANLLAVIAFGMVGMNILVFYLINDIMEREVKMHENKVFQIQAKNQLEMYRSISENFDNLKKKTHEFKNQISCIESLLDKKQYFKLEEYVKRFMAR